MTDASLIAGTLIWLGVPLWSIASTNKRIAKALEHLRDLAGTRR